LTPIDLADNGNAGLKLSVTYPMGLVSGTEDVLMEDVEMPLAINVAP
jgi:hypothetical protein